ncbi:hypothetical protein MT418_006357 [Batrachochytrium dendrobatidis]
MSHEYEKIKLNTNTPQSTSAPPATNHNAAAEDWPVLEGSFVKDSGHSKQLFSEPQHTIQDRALRVRPNEPVTLSAQPLLHTQLPPIIQPITTLVNSMDSPSHAHDMSSLTASEQPVIYNKDERISSQFTEPAQQATQTAQVPESIDTQAHRRMPPDFLASFTSPTTTSYTLCIVQHPLQARMSGYSIRDRRPLDPTPIVQVVVPDDISDLQSFEDSPFLVAQASLWKPDMHTELCTAASAPVSDLVAGTAPAPDLPPKSRNSQILLGSIVVACQLLTNIAGERGLYFVFTDLSIRTSGFFRLQISLYDLRRYTYFMMVDCISPLMCSLMVLQLCQYTLNCFKSASLP